MSPQLAQLRAALDSLQSYQLPDRYADAFGQSNAAEAADSSESAKRHPNTLPLLDAAVVARYRKARDKYLRQRISQLFLEHVGTFEPSDNDMTGSFQFPPQVSKEEEEELRKMQEETKSELIATAKKVQDQFSNLQAKFDVFVERRGELERIVSEMEQANTRKQDANHTNSNEMEDEEQCSVNPEDMALEDDRLAALIQKRNELEQRLRRVRAETVEIEDECARKRDTINEMRRERGAYPTTSERVSDETTLITPEMSNAEIDENAAAVEAETAEYLQRAQELKEMNEWNNTIREAMEELGGLKILSVENAPDTNTASEVENVCASQSQAARRRRASVAAVAKKPNNSTAEVLILKLLILDKHILKIGLSSTGVHKVGQEETLRVLNATLVTPTVISESVYSEENKDDSSMPTVQLRIPSLDDLVELSANLGPVEDIRFVVRETSARIRALNARVDELAKLRTKYLTKISVPSTSPTRLTYGYGNEDQEIVCSLNEGVTVVLRLNSDCPLIEGSAYIHQIVGVGGWEQNVLERLKDRVNGKYFRGPTDIMDSLVEEIARVEKDDGVVVPRTPHLPKKKKRIS